MKPTNPKERIGIKKVSMSVVPATVLSEVAVGMTEGAKKYGPYNWRTSGVRASVYYDATMRHLMRWWEREDLDPDSKLSHLTKAICSLMVLRDGMLQGVMTDDRPANNLELGACMDQLDNLTAELIGNKVEEVMDPYCQPEDSVSDRPDIDYIAQYFSKIVYVNGEHGADFGAPLHLLERWPSGMVIMLQGNHPELHIEGEVYSEGYRLGDFELKPLPASIAQTVEHCQNRLGVHWGVVYVHRGRSSEPQTAGTPIPHPQTNGSPSAGSPVLPFITLCKEAVPYTNTLPLCRQQDANGNCQKPNCDCWRVYTGAQQLIPNT